MSPLHAPAATFVPDGEPVPVREITLRADGVTLSGLLAEASTTPRALLVALHGGGMRAGYFHGRADPATSLLSLAASCGYSALALDRPGYGGSATELSEGMALAEQAHCLRTAVAAYRRDRPSGAGVLLVGHSLGAKAALYTASRWTGGGLLGVDVAGISDRWAVPPAEPTTSGELHRHHMQWGPLALYPPGTFRMARTLVAPVPVREAREISHWPDVYRQVAPGVRVPVRFTHAEYERWWRTDPRTVRAMTARLGTSLVRSERLPRSGHNISLGRTARTYHLRVLAFLEECLALAEQRAR